MKDFVWISDVHFSNSTLDVAVPTTRQALEMARKSGLPLVVSGDLHDTKAVLRGEEVGAMLDLFGAFSDVKIYVLIGNHDLINERNNSPAQHALRFLSYLPNVIVIDSVQQHGEWWFVPYQNSSEKFREIVQGLKQTTKRIICHQGFFGAKMGNYVVDQTSVSPIEMMDFDIVLSGHYHEHHKVGPKEHIVYCGSPYTTTFAEVGQKKYFHVVTIEELRARLASYETNARKHISISLHQDGDRSKNPVNEEIRPQDLLRIELHGEKAWISKFSKQGLAEKFGTENISIVPKPVKPQSLRMEIKNELQMNDVVKGYLDKAKTNLDKSKLMDFFSKELQ